MYFWYKSEIKWYNGTMVHYANCLCFFVILYSFNISNKSRIKLRKTCFAPKK